MRRAAALLAAVAMVVAAFAYRSARDDGGDPVHGDRVDDAADAGLVCAADLADVCAAAGVEVVATPSAGETADALVAAGDAGALGGAAWLTTSAWASLVEAELARTGQDPVFAVDAGPLASSPVVVAVWQDRAVQLAERCGLTASEALGWRCLAEQDGATLRAGDRVQVAGPEVASAAGLVVAASQAAGVLGRTEFFLNDPDAGDLSRFAPGLAGRPTADPVRRMRAEGPGQVTAAGALAATATNLATSFGTIQPTVPDPAVRADVVLVVPAGVSVDDETRRALTDALLSNGWDPPADGPDGLPAGGVLAAIRTLWTQSR